MFKYVLFVPSAKCLSIVVFPTCLAPVTKIALKIVHL